MNMIEQIPTQPQKQEKLAEESQEVKKEELSTALQEVEKIPLNFSDEEYEKVSRDTINDRHISREVSEDAFLRFAKNPDTNPSSFGTMLRILDRDSMKDHPNEELFKKVIEELAKKYNYEIRK